MYDISYTSCAKYILCKVTRESTFENGRTRAQTHTHTHTHTHTYTHTETERERVRERDAHRLCHLRVLQCRAVFNLAPA